ncbi:hypothetical protein PFISCL1PPCAC_2629, partial [Pristionchus fissidentatus]
IYFGHNALTYVVVLSFIPFALNRFTALRNPTTYSEIWKLPLTLFLILLCWVGGIIIASPVFFYPNANFSYVPSASLGGLALLAGDEVLQYDSVSAISTIISSFGVCVILYILAFIELKRVLSAMYI